MVSKGTVHWSEGSLARNGLRVRACVRIGLRVWIRLTLPRVRVRLSIRTGVRLRVGVRVLHLWTNDPSD